MDELKHFGIKGQKWGLRRYENPDGTLTAEGRERYSKPRKTTALDVAANVVSLGAYGKIKRKEARRAARQMKGKRTAPRTSIGLTAKGAGRTVGTIGHAAAVKVITNYGAKRMKTLASTASTPRMAKGLETGATLLKIFGDVNIAATAAYNFHAQSRDTINYTNNRYNNRYI